MQVRFRTELLRRIARENGSHTAEFAPQIVRRFRERVQQIEAAQDERDLRALKSLRYKKLAGERAHQRSLRLNDQWRLIVEVDTAGQCTVVDVIAIEDYH